jgi:pyrroloquinoline-quinone synthase
MPSSFRDELKAAILERHCANHPMTDKWARGELSRNALMGWGIEHWHWVSNVHDATFYRCARAPRDVKLALLGNWNEETDPERPHLDIVLRFAAANGADVEAVKRGRGLPTTEAWVAWQVQVAREQSWVAGVASLVGTESQSPMLYGKVLPALRETYKYPEDAIEHFWLHAEADVEHGDRGFEVLERHCTTHELQEEAIHYARESARRRWFHFDGIYLHYEMGYKLQ